jgi:phosphatidylglycerol---prolipoprotein diacylglyceryl transferase
VCLWIYGFKPVVLPTLQFTLYLPPKIQDPMMSTWSYIIWNGSPEIFSIGPITLRWYGLLFALGFLISQQILYYMFRKEGKPERDVETLTIYMLVATIVGARLGHIFFYEPEIIWTDPLSIFMPFQFTPEFKFTGLMGLASHGAAVGILFGLWLYSRKKKPGQNYLQTLDRIVILVTITGALIRFGNYFNSEILGKPTDAPTGIVFINRMTEAIEGDKSNPGNLVESTSVHRVENSTVSPEGIVPIKIFIFFKPGVAESDINLYMGSEMRNILFYLSEFVNQPPGPVRYEIVFDDQGKQYMARVLINGIVRHPAQLYESISCVILFALLFSIWYRNKNNLPEGRIFGFFMIILWTLRFVYEYLKENQVAFENSLPLNMGQILSIPLVLVGIFVLIRSYRQQPENS